MDTSDRKFFPRTPTSSSFALGVVTAIVYIAGFAMVAAWFALLLLGQPDKASAPRALSSCSVCGVVERVGEFERASLQIRGEQSEGFVVLLAALGGSLQRGTAPGKYYETAVLHDDGSVRIVRDHSVPEWKRGDRVKVIKGRIEAGVISTAAPAASPAGRTPSPTLPVAQAQ